MSVRTRCRFGSLGAAAFVVLAVSAMAAQPSLAQDRTLATLADVSTVMPAPYHPHAATAVYSASLYDSNPYYGGVRYWH